MPSDAAPPKTDTTAASGPPALDARRLRDAFGAFMTGVTIVATRDAAGAPRGFTANSFTSVSLDPPLLLVCVGRSASSAPVFAAAPGFAVSVLAEAQQSAAMAFASKSADRFAAVRWRESAQGWPIIEDASAWFDCVVHDRVAAGDHDVLIGRVVDFDVSARNGLGYARGGFFTLGAAQAALEVAATDAQALLGALVVADRDGAQALFLEPDGEGGWRPPIVEVAGGGSEALAARLKALGVSSALGPLYAVIDSKRRGLHAIYHQAVAGANDPAEGRFFALDALPYEAIDGEALGAMLRRFVEEHRARRFDVLFGDDASAAARRLADR